MSNAVQLAPARRKPDVLRQRGPEAEPTRVRYGVLAYLCSLSFILYIDRSCIGKAAPSMQNDLGLTHTQMGYVFGAFTIAYCLFEMPTGRLGDRFGSRGVLTRIVLWWSLFTALTGCVWNFTLDSGFALELPGVRLPLLVNGFLLLLAIRFLFGAGEAGALPNSARVIARWFPPHARGPAQGWTTTAALLGGAAAPVLAAYLIGLVGWRLSFVIFGSLGLAWAAAFYRWFRDDPAEHPAVNEAECRFIAAGCPAGLGGSGHGPIPWRRVLASANVWLLGGIVSCTAFVSSTYLFWYPTYLEQGRGTDPVTTGWLAGLVLAGGAVGAVLGGYLNDAVLRRTGDRRQRRWVGCAGFLAAAGLLAAGIRCDSPLASALCISMGYLGVTAAFTTWWAVVTDVSGEHVGALFGLMNSLALPGALGSSVFIGWLVDWRMAHGHQGRDQWEPALWVCVAVLLAAAACWLAVKPTRPIIAGDRSGRRPA
jgi:MFS family permease